ncbi:hypothetical protein Fot_27721 [Forsythia ovata]|uniref:Uncharacterized protein n=1 Tax=Forsythia ovata TaxID=205694 RepID=A0ABD1TLZ3_9LAMI
MENRSRSREIDENDWYTPKIECAPIKRTDDVHKCKMNYPHFLAAQPNPSKRNQASTQTNKLHIKHDLTKDLNSTLTILTLPYSCFNTVEALAEATHIYGGLYNQDLDRHKRGD